MANSINKGLISISEEMNKILKWTLIGLAIRVILMPFTSHGQDLVFLYYFPMVWVENGIWNPYELIQSQFSYYHTTYYGPVLFFIMSGVFAIIRLLSSSLSTMLLTTSSALCIRGFHYIYYTFPKFDLFLMKSPYLVLDFLIGGMLYKLKGLTAYKFWMLNIIVLHAVYMVGGAYLIPTLFIAIALYFAMKDKPYLCMIALGLGGGTMIFPYFLLLPACFILSPNWENRISLLFAGVIASLIPYIPFGTTGLINISHMNYPLTARLILGGIFVIGYSLICLFAKKEKIPYYFAAVLFLCYACFPMRFRYFVFATPMLCIIIPKHRKFGIFMIFIVGMLGFQWLTCRDLQLGLFATLHMGFLNIPTIQEVIGRFVNIELLYKINARLLVIAFLSAFVWSLKMAREDLI
jgi:hypothetical protein